MGIIIDDGTAIPVIDENKTIDMAFFENKIVAIYGNIFYGVIIGGSANIDVQEQTATGYRIDAISIQTLLNKP